MGNLFVRDRYKGPFIVFYIKIMKRQSHIFPYSIILHVSCGWILARVLVLEMYGLGIV
jgi:hypothetical protein